ncbi:MAG: hypothetical protein ACD_32C00136G0002 [uncultured bacterium]|nr:MAG: hypothetical protein ACD_32C00136G0002 [uncultured bacterium]
MNNIFGAVALLSLAIPGFFINLIILGKKRVNEAFALSWLTGSIVFTLSLYVTNVFLGIKLNLTSSLSTFAVITVLSFFIAGKRITIPVVNFKSNLLLKLILVAVPLLMFITAFFYPVADWDAITLFDFRARILLNEGFLVNKIIEMIYGGYPMYTSLLHFWVYVTGLWTPMPIYPLFTVSLAGGIFFVLRKLYSVRISLLISLAVIFVPRLFANSFIPYTNLPYTVLLMMGVLYIYLWTKSKNTSDLIFGLLLSAATFWVRDFPFALVNFVLVFLAIPIVKKYSKVLSIAAAIILVFIYFIPEFHTIANYLKYTVYEYYSPYWMVFASVFIYKLIKKQKDWFWALAYLGYGTILFAGTYIFNTSIPGYYTAVFDAVQRMTIFINIPVVLFASSIFEN